jgi:hypothetical protein
MRKIKGRGGSAAKQVPPQPGTIPALGLRAGAMALSLYRRPPLERKNIMWFSSWLRNRVINRLRRWDRFQIRPTAQRFRPRLEAFEDRCLPSGLPYPTAATVSQLIADINYADNSGGAFTINLKPSTTFDLIKADNKTNGANGLPVIGSSKAVDLTIVGNGDPIERVGNRSGSNAFRLFDVAPGASLTLDHVTLQGGWASGTGAAGDGGAVYNQGTLTVSNGSTFSGSAHLGSGIYNNGGMVTVSNSNLSGIYNTGGTVTVSNCTGGGISNDIGTVTVSNSTLSGGGISNYGGTLTVTNSTLSGNSADTGGGIYNNAGTVSVSNSTLSNNSATYGGGIYNYGGAVTVSHSILSGNTARYGGGIYNVGGSVTVSNGSTLSGNSAIADFYSNRLGYGGGIYIYSGTVTISDSILSGNTADAAVGLGGGIFNGGTLTVTNSSSITGNSASDGADVYNGGVLYLQISTSTIGVLDGNPGNLI